jgi:formate-nitrite transporter family protein
LSTDRNGYGQIVTAAPDPMEIYERSEDEGRRRLSMSALELTSTAFVAGITIVFGMAAMGVVESLAAARLGNELGRLLGALGFALGLVFLIVGRTERTSAWRRRAT